MVLLCFNESSFFNIYNWSCFIDNTLFPNAYHFISDVISRNKVDLDINSECTIYDDCINVVDI